MLFDILCSMVTPCAVHFCRGHVFCAKQFSILLLIFLAMAFQTPSHRDFNWLRPYLCLNLSMTGLTGHTGVDVSRMIKIGIILQIMPLKPDQRLVIPNGLMNFLDLR